MANGKDSWYQEYRLIHKAGGSIESVVNGYMLRARYKENIFNFMVVHGGVFLLQVFDDKSPLKPYGHAWHLDVGLEFTF